jgi:hypothetical protein
LELWQFVLQVRGETYLRDADYGLVVEPALPASQEVFGLQNAGIISPYYSEWKYRIISLQGSTAIQQCVNWIASSLSYNDCCCAS